MGRAVQGAGSGRSGERSKKIGQVRAKRKKRKRDLEELHRNVLEAKRRARTGAAQNTTKWKTNFAKVLSNFADKRRDNDEGREILGDGKSRRKKRRTICDRLLPEPIVGIYQNGAKGREIRRAVGRLSEMNVARLRGNVLKLLKGDETNVKSSWESEEKGERERANSDRPLDVADESDCEIVKCRRVKDGLVHANTKGIIANRTNREGTGTVKLRDDGTRRIETKDEATELLPRQRDEDKCRRRLFEPDDDENEPTKNSFGIIDRPMITDHEIRFSPRRIEKVRDTRNFQIAEHCEKEAFSRDLKPQHVEDNGDKHYRAINDVPINANFWGQSPVTCYEKLCAEISIHNFEDKSSHRHKDPVTKIQGILKGLFIQNGRGLQENPIKLSTKAEDSEKAIPWRTIGGSNCEDEIYQACTQTSDMEQCSSADSSVTMIGSWHPEKSQRYRSNDDTTSVFDEKTERDSDRFGNTRKRRGTVRESTGNGNEKNEVSCSSDVVEKTINSVSAFLKQFQNHNPPEGRRIRNAFETEIDRDVEAGGEKLNACLETPPQDAKYPDTLKCASRKNTIKHVPAILRRSVERHSERMDHNENPRGFSRSKPAQRIPEQRIPDDKNPIFSALRPLIPTVSEPRSIDETSSPCVTSILRQPNYYHYRTPARETGNDPVQLRQRERLNNRKAKLNLTGANNNSRLSWPKGHGTKDTLEGDYESDPPDRQIELTRRDFSKIVTVNNNDTRNHSKGQSRLEIVEVPLDPKSTNENGGQIMAGKRVSFFNESDGFFEPNYWKSTERFEPDIQQRRDDREARIETTLTDHSRDHYQNNSTYDTRIPSFEFPTSDIDRNPTISYRSKDPRKIAVRKLQSGNPQDSRLLYPQARNTNASSLGLEDDDTMRKPQHLITNGLEDRWQYAEVQSTDTVPPVHGHSRFRKSESHQRVYGNPQIDRPNDGSIYREPQRLSRKPVVLFRPIEDSRHRSIPQTQNRDVHHNESSEAIGMREAVRNLRVMAFEEKNVGENRHPRRSERIGYRQIQQRDFPAHCGRQLWAEGHANQLNLESLEPYAQPAKFLAYERTDDGNPRRVPIYGKFYVPDLPPGKSNKRNASELLTSTDNGLQSGDSLYMRSLDVAKTSGDQNVTSDRLVGRTGSFILTSDRSYVYDDESLLARSESDMNGLARQRSRRVALMMPLSSLHRQQTSKIAPSNALPVQALEKTSSNDVLARKILYSVDERGRLVQSGQSRYRLVESSIPVTAPITINAQQSDTIVDFSGGPFNNAANLPERIQLPDGRIGVLLAENSEISNSSQRFNADIRGNPVASCKTKGPDANTDLGSLYKFSQNNGIYRQSDHQWNTQGYDANEAYRRSTRANGVLDTFTGV